MPSCPYCNTLINEEENFCINCERPVKCMVCSGYLRKDKSKCLKCGTPLNVPQTNSIPMNTFSLREKQANNYYSKTISLSFTDNAIDRVAPVLSGHVPLTTPISRQQRIVVTEPTNALPPSEGLNEETEYIQDESIQEKNVENGH